MRLWRGDETGGEFFDYQMPAQEGEVVLDVIHRVQATQAPDLACRWNCKAGKCGSCSAEINGRPVADVHDPDGHPPARGGGDGGAHADLPHPAGPGHRRLLQLRGGQADPAVQPRPKTADEEEAGGYRMQQIDVERSQEFRKCIECFLCQDVCHVIRDHEENKTAFAGPRFFARSAELEMHPLDVNDRRELLQKEQGLGSATSPSAARRCAPSTSRSPTTPSSR